MSEGSPPHNSPGTAMAINQPKPQPVVTFQDMERMAAAIAKSGLFGMKTPDQALALMVIAQAEGLHPGIVARDYHIIQGRPTLKADTMLARFQQSGGKVEWTCLTDERVAGIWSHPSSPRPIEMDWTIERARAIKQLDKDGNLKAITDKENWRNYPRAMLRARLISEAVRTLYPAVSVGVYTPEEVQDMDKREALDATYEVVPPQQQPTTDPRPAEVQGQPTASQQPAGRYNARGDLLASGNQVGLIQRMANERGIARDEIYAQFKINQSLTDELLASEVDEVVQWLKQFPKLDDSDKLRY
jgi:hypothetical protein